MKSTTTLANSCEGDFIEMFIQNISGIESSERENLHYFIQKSRKEVITALNAA